MWYYGTIRLREKCVGKRIYYRPPGLDVPKPEFKKKAKQKRKKRRSKARPNRAKKFGSRIEYYAYKLNKNLPPAERWFRQLWDQAQLNLDDTLFNFPYGNYIPDVINGKHKFIIEIDEPHHEDPVQRWKDGVRDRYFVRQGYVVYRIKAYDLENYNDVISRLKTFLSGNSPVHEQGRTQKQTG
jgi:very-short-patch-repair endonuclease